MADYFKNMSEADISRFVSDVISKKPISDETIKSMLSATDEESLQKMFSAARAVRNHFFSNNVYLYSFVYFSTYCKNKCAFCYYRAANKIDRYRLTPEELRDMCKQLKNEGVHMIDLTMGEDPHFHDHPENLIEFVTIAKETAGLPVMISPGVVDDKFIEQLAAAGANFFALYQETYQQNLYEKLRIGQSFDGRIQARTAARAAGMCVEDGMLTGFSKSVLNTPDFVVDDVEAALLSLREMQKFNADQVRVMTFEPQPGTPLEETIQAPYLMEIKIISVLRFLFPDRLIPASLDVAGIDGMVDRLNAGANVVTSIISADSTLEGVVNFDRDVPLSARKRDAKSVIERLKTMGMQPGTQADFEKYLKRNQ
ncbi:[FeFe] hydrogenase maturase subunit HydE [Methanosarcinaceae archaeon Ag5]|uniref:[FeFe] hydrogenase maturase subunit HydE n=1 Tax=Methanolapillus africanus TaxID=3028297 RepID=A0AAE4MIJ7_9EURY|nr:[FeFe] hydrogenase maturase subunit HydE [Methanosarcinaceae archaeon Ag5]